MVTLASSLGPSPAAWAFFTAISVALIGVLGAQLKSYSDLKRVKALSERTKSAVDKAAQSATAAQENTTSISNGFASKVLGRLNAIYDEQQRQGASLRKHLEWHLDQKNGGRE